MAPDSRRDGRMPEDTTTSTVDGAEAYERKRALAEGGRYETDARPTRADVAEEDGQ